LNSLDTVSENPQIPNLIKIRPFGAEVFHADTYKQAGRKADI
jgi:hypothetical protein